MNRKTIDFPFELKALNKKQFEGYGSIFGNVDLGGDVVISGAFNKTLKTHKANGTLPQMFWMHRADQVPGKWLEMEEDSRGLYVKGELADTNLGQEMHELMKMKAVRGLSIGYRTEEADYDKEGNRLLKQIELWEVSIVSLAMNPLASVTHAKSRLTDLGEYVPTEREFEAGLIEKFGCSRRRAKEIVSAVKSHDQKFSGMLDDHNLRDADAVDPDELKAALDAINNLTDKVGATIIRMKRRA